MHSRLENSYKYKMFVMVLSSLKNERFLLITNCINTTENEKGRSLRVVTTHGSTWKVFKIYCVLEYCIVVSKMS
jgi:hypothetical protein